MSRKERLRANSQKYNASDKGKARHRRYRQSAKGQAACRRAAERSNKRRIYMGGGEAQYLGTARTEELAAMIRQHIRRRRDEFKQGFAHRTQAESVSTGGAQTQTAL